MKHFISCHTQIDTHWICSLTDVNLISQICKMWNDPMVYDNFDQVSSGWHKPSTGRRFNIWLLCRFLYHMQNFFLTHISLVQIKGKFSLLNDLMVTKNDSHTSISLGCLGSGLCLYQSNMWSILHQFTLFTKFTNEHCKKNSFWQIFCHKKGKCHSQWLYTNQQQKSFYVF